MSTKIRAFMEYVPHTEYLLFAELFLWQDYQLFALMANVRYEPEIIRGIPPVSEPKGLPEDLSPKLRQIYEDYAGVLHSASWLNVQELMEVHAQYMKIPPLNTGTELDVNNQVTPKDYTELLAIISMMTVLDSDCLLPSRLVFWFVG